MPRRKHRRKQPARSEHARASPAVPDSIVDSDADSISSSVADDYIANLMEQSATEPDVIEISSAEEAIEVSSTEVIEVASSLAIEVSSTERMQIDNPAKAQQPRWQQSLMQECRAAYISLTSSGRHAGSFTFKAAPPRQRLVQHRAVELFGATSTSSGQGRGRYVTAQLSSRRATLSEARFDRAVETIVKEVFPERKKDKKNKKTQRKGRGKKDKYADMPPVSGLRVLREIPDRREPKGKKAPPRKSALDAPAVGHGNKGFAMLQKMGWKQGDGLGVDSNGRREPLTTECRNGRAGLGG